jgi:maltose alpha-D-glucosyltransferase / alpha-amylase
MSPRSRARADSRAATDVGTRSRRTRAPEHGRIRASELLAPDPHWYKDAIVYEIPVRAYFDGNGDGTGDFPGLIEKLDYVQDLGVTAIWILPFYPSPLRDGGYDIADYADVNPTYGTLRDFRRFLDAAHERGIRVITELVINHTSSEHPWFQRARRSPPGSRWRNFYVWSDTPERYRDARIIFQDFESSNWSWDPVAKAYYWHRFYHHQPDLNFESPDVRKAIFQILDFWMGMGVDGLRLDAIPYLYQREGTNCENLPETHAFLKQLRSYVDERYADRMLLAEANQWPEDAAEYFGDGDECHMNFHFPLMPRMFMSIQLESSFPILDILEQTPALPESCQWAIFLRNHDELTLEMVTDEDRDFMYRMYAEDPRARLNLGIRRRLAPLLKERRKIELMHGLLFSMPGTPVLYYGDEIGMGDNIYLGDRDGVRTPMQWSAGRNAGFSSANPQRLYLPVIIDPEYHCEAVNVEAQQNNSFSLLWWMKRIIGLRKQHRVFGHGGYEFLRPRNNKVLAFFRHDEDERMLVVANLSRFSQYVELDLSAYRGMVPIELFGHTEFPQIGEHPYILTLGPHSFYWLALRPPKDTEALVDTSTLPELVVEGAWSELLEGRGRTRLERVLLAWMVARRWFRGKARRRRSAKITDVVRITGREDSVVMTFVRVEYVDGAVETYVIPLACVEDEEAWQIDHDNPGAAIARVAFDGDGEHTGLLCDAAVLPRLGTGLLDIMAGSRRMRGQHGQLRGSGSRGLRSRRRELAEARLLELEQSNTNLVFGEQFLLKLLRVIEPGIHPEEEMGRFLTDRARFTQIPRLRGSLQYEAGKQTSTVAILQEFVPSDGDAWRLTCGLVGQSYDRILETSPGEIEPPRPSSPLGFRVGQPIPGEGLELLGPFLSLVEQLGRRVGEMHLALTLGPDDPAFACEPFSVLHQRSLYQSARGLLGRTWEMLERALPDLPEPVRDEAKWALAQRKNINARLRRIHHEKLNAMRIRCHGDLHLGQLLHTGGDFVIIDFEGEPARTLAERRFKRSPLRDVAGMLRSFHYAAMAELGEGQRRPEDAALLLPWAEAWVAWASTVFVEAWLAVTRGADLIPDDAQGRAVLLDFYLLEKCIYEVGYELGNRPSWLPIPIGGLRSLLSGDRSQRDDPE